MNQIAKMFQLSNERMTSIMDGKFDRDTMLTAYREFTGQIKLVNAVIKAYQVSEKNPSAIASLRKMKMIDDETPLTARRVIGE